MSKSRVDFAKSAKKKKNDEDEEEDFDAVDDDEDCFDDDDLDDGEDEEEDSDEKKEEDKIKRCKKKFVDKSTELAKCACGEYYIVGVGCSICRCEQRKLYRSLKEK